MISDEDEEVGPSVDSNDPDERIAARRFRIQKRLEAQRRSALGDGADEKATEDEEPRKSKKQIEDSRIRLCKLVEDGKILVSNIRVAGDAREQFRRTEEEDIRRQRKERLEQESKAGGERFDEITKRWTSALEKEIPQHLHEALMEQKAACDAMVDEKNKLINDFQADLKSKDDMYVKDLKKQAEDIDLLVERMVEQINNLSKAKRQELNEIEKSFIMERNELLEQNHKKWNERMEHRREKEEEYLKTRAKHVEEQEESLQLLRTQDWEEYNQVKIHLESDVQILEQQLQQMRATYQLNQEKLEYNFQVLKKRDEENTITKSQQKRKITRLQDVLNALRTKSTKQDKQYADENQQLTDDYKRITEHFHELQMKSKHFIAADAKKFHDVWCMNEAECKDLVNSIVNADRLICEQQLGFEYNQPDLNFMENVGPLNASETRGDPVPASEVVRQVLASTAMESDLVTDDIEVTKGRSTIIEKMSAHTIKRIFELLCDESGFLVEEKLKTLLAPLDPEERSLITLDSIFSALGVETEDDVHSLSKYFIKVKAEFDEPFYKMDENGYQLWHRYEDKSTIDGDEENTREEDATDIEGEGETDKTLLSEGAELMDRNVTYKVLRDFVENAKKTIVVKDKRSQFHLDTLEERDDGCDAEYWAKYVDVISDRKEEVLDAFLQALAKYREVLSARAKLLTDTEGLKQQNVELRMLLHQYVNSKVNKELEIPPTRVLQLEMNSNNPNMHR